MTRLVNWVGTAWLSISVALLLVTVVTVLCQVVFRYLLELPLAWTGETSRISLVCAVYAGLPAAYVRSEHIVVDFFVNLLPKSIFFAYVLVLKLITALVIGYFAIGAFLQAEATRNMTFISLPDVPVAIVYAVQGTALAFFALLILVTWSDPEKYFPRDHEGLDA
ncbi:MAG TPA: TRAP transporter small permease subunit [Alphaproteobacteria bacterium]|nr:TRAP transporter small permease subunit [Alphaproteobacteria bacterium]